MSNGSNVWMKTPVLLTCFFGFSGCRCSTQVFISPCRTKSALKVHSLSHSILSDWNRFPVAHHFWLTSSDWAASSHSLHMITHKFHKTISSTRGGRGWWWGGRWGSLSSSSSSRTAAWRARPQPARARRLWLVWLCLASLIHSSPHSIPITSPPPASPSPQTFKNSSTTDVHYCPMPLNSVSQWFMPPLIRSAVAD